MPRRGGPADRAESVEYYTKIERGDETNATPSVINAIARVLRLSDVEREYIKVSWLE